MSIVELLWTLFGVVGSYISYGNLQDAKSEIEALNLMNGNRLAQHDTMLILAYGHYRNNLFRFSKNLVVTLIGVIACILPPQNPRQPVTPTGIVITVGLFTIVLLLLMASALDKRQREALNQ